MSWERDCVKLATDLSNRRHDSMGWRGDAIAMGAMFTKGASALRFAQSLECLPPEPMIRDPTVAERPSDLEEALEHCEKQFQQWNVERAERDAPFSLEPVARFKIGAAGQLPEELRVPRWEAHASLGLEQWIQRQAMEKFLDTCHRRGLRQLLTEPLPYGRDDDDDPSGGWPEDEQDDRVSREDGDGPRRDPRSD